ncbi:hypothetical protein [Anaplasma capra]|uniref:hypothetical protein n=1 Tax=Anaplasma capra TaxID=1562740 RepID=UPI0021D5DA92|nr:hypothetical protein [Anaplasma capra]MCU7611665.1 hypothetical protein [Anaplasma capra]MCU7612186.1 hypothetical protein [Anaplasma capra]
MTHNHKVQHETALLDSALASVDELLKEKEEQFQYILDSILRSFLERISHTLGEEFIALLQKEYVKLFGGVTFDDLHTTGIPGLHQKNQEIMSRIIAEIIQEALKNFAAI